LETQSLEKISTHELKESYQRIFKYAPNAEFSGISSIEYRRCEKCDLRFFYPPVAGPESLYKALRIQMGTNYYMHDKAEYQIARHWISKRDSVLDVGCGEGAFAATVPDSRYTGLELNSDAVMIARQSGREVVKETIEEHSANHPGEYDVVCSFQVLEHVPDVRGFLLSGLRALKTGGLLITCVPSFDTFLRFQTNSLLNMPPHHLTHWSDLCVRQISSIFPLQLEAVEHESLADVHCEAYAVTLVMAALGGRRRLLDSSLRTKFLMRVSTQLGKVLCKGLQDESMRPRGHSVIATHRKTGDLVDS
jgi:SAM-dependent methyltransferase